MCIRDRSSTVVIAPVSRLLNIRVRRESHGRLVARASQTRLQAALPRDSKCRSKLDDASNDPPTSGLLKCEHILQAPAFQHALSRPILTRSDRFHSLGAALRCVCIPRYNRHSTARAARPSRPRAPRSRGAPRGAPSTVQPPVRSHQAGIRQAPVGPS